MSRDAADDVKDVKDWGMGEPQKYTAEIILEAETVYENHAEDHREKIREQRRKKSSCIGCFDRLYLKEIPYEAIAKNEAAAELGLDLFEYNLTTDQVNRLRQALSTNTNLPWVEIDWKSLTSDQKNVLLNLKHPMVLENFFIHKYDERPLPKACAEGELDDVRVMVELIDTEIGDVTEAKDKNGKTGAYLAAFNGKDQVVAYLLENGANDKDVHEGELDGMKKKYGNQPFLPKACAEGCYNDVKAAIEKFKENVNESKDKNGKTGAYLAAFNGKDQVVAYLLENGAKRQDVHEGARAKQERDKLVVGPPTKWLSKLTCWDTCMMNNMMYTPCQAADDQNLVYRYTRINHDVNCCTVYCHRIWWPLCLSEDQRLASEALQRYSKMHNLEFPDVGCLGKLFPELHFILIKREHRQHGFAPMNLGAPQNLVMRRDAVQPSANVGEPKQAAAVKVSIVVPHNATPGSMIQIKIPDGRTANIEIPPGAQPGAKLEVMIPCF
jgi:hypothetical protein